MSDEKRKIIVDEDWKSQVEREREQLREHVTEASAGDAASATPQPGEPDMAAQRTTVEQGGGSADFDMPAPSLPMLISTLATQAIAAMGQLPDPETGQPIVRPKLAKYHIDLLAVLQEKTKGNVTSEEADMLEGALHELRMIYVQVVQQSGN